MNMTAQAHVQQSRGDRGCAERGRDGNEVVTRWQLLQCGRGDYLWIIMGVTGIGQLGKGKYGWMEKLTVERLLDAVGVGRRGESEIRGDASDCL